MNFEYYSEDIISNTKYREEYVDTINFFLKKSCEDAQKNREEYINPDLYYNNQEKYRKDFIEMLGYPLKESKHEKIKSEKEFVATDKNVNIFRIQLEINAIRFYGIYFEQITSDETTPFVICLHGGEGTPELISSIYENSSNYNHMARKLTDRGCSVFCPQLLLWNKSFYGNEYNRNDVNGRLLMLGGSVTALEVFLISRSIDYFIDNEEINSDRIGVAGLSYGGQFALDLAACDTRIKACHSSCYFNNRFKYPELDWCNYNGLNKISDAEKAALVCPRALSINVGKEDYLFSPEGAESENKRAKKYFERFNVSEKYDFYVFDGTHEEDKGDRWLEFLLKNL